MKVPKIVLSVAIIFFVLNIIFMWFPTFAIGQIQASKDVYNSVPNYKLDEAIQMWRIWQITIFQPLTVVFSIIFFLLLVYSCVYIVVSYYKK